MRFQVPQFIEVEDKIFGPFTLKQFIYLAGGAGICFVAWRFLPFLFAVPIMVGAGALGLALAFYKVNNKPFIHVLEAFLKFFMGSKLYIWKKEAKYETKTRGQEKTAASIYIPKLSDSKLRDLTWSLDVKQSANPVTTDEKTRKDNVF